MLRGPSCEGAKRGVPDKDRAMNFVVLIILTNCSEEQALPVTCSTRKLGWESWGFNTSLHCLVEPRSQRLRAGGVVQCRVPT